jgi:SAM-dependent methyltransferase
MDLVEYLSAPAIRHPWEQARSAFFTRILLDATAEFEQVRCLDVGCGDGWFARQLFDVLPPDSRVIGWDIGLDTPLIQELSRDLPEGMALTETAPRGRFNLILCMDVIEHVPDDVAFVTDLVHRYLEPDGILLCCVPAWPRLYGRHDLALRHYRRYNPAATIPPPERLACRPPVCKCSRAEVCFIPLPWSAGARYCGMRAIQNRWRQDPTVSERGKARGA